jgi:hypothetical protein
MSFIIGFGFLICLLFFSALLLGISKFIPKEAAISLIVFMILGDGIMVALWYFVLGEYVPDLKLFRLGIGTAFCAGAFSRSIYFLFASNKNNTENSL